MDLSDLNAEQAAAAQHNEGPLLVVAGAGTGKTEVITRRIVYLIEAGLAKPSEILALTFTDKAAQEMEERVDRMLPYGLVETRIMTFHSFCNELLKQYGIDMGLSPDMQLLSKAQQIVFLRDHIDNLNLQYYAPASTPDKYLEALVTYFSRLKEELIEVGKYKNYASGLVRSAEGQEGELEAAKHFELARAYETYINLCREKNLIDFSDQIGLAIELLKKRPNVLKQIKAQIKYILVDEFQDTNVAQNRLLEILAGRKGNIMVVGDDDQSIYKFRGAAISNILSFSEHFDKIGQVVLATNYRSSQPVLDASYRLIKHNNPDRLEVRNGINKYLTSGLNGPMPLLVSAPTYSLEADAMAESIKERLKAGEQGGTIVVLVRKRKQAETVIQALRAKEIDYHFSAKQNLYIQPEIEIMLYFLQYIVDPTDSTSLYHLLAGDVFKIDVSYLMVAAATARRQNRLLEEVIKSDSDGSIPAEFFAQVRRWRELSTTHTVGQLLFDFLKETGYLDLITESSKSNPAEEAKIRNIARFFALVEEYEAVAEDKRAMAYTLHSKALRGAGDEPDATQLDSSRQQIQVMTIHQAKGLEFQTVYLFDLTQGSFPATRRPESIVMPDALLDEVLPEGDWHVQEERRLMYVALTRAKRNLILSWSPDHGGKRPKKPSIFIAEALGVPVEAPDVGGLPTALRQIELFKFEPSSPPSLQPKFMHDDILHLTPHQVDDYLTCPENFRYLYILEVPQPPQPGLMYGNLIHNIIHQYHLWRRRGPVELEQLLGLIDGGWRSDGFISKGQEERRREQAVATIRRFYEREQAAKVQPAQVEQEFQFELAEQKVVIRGRFDAVYNDSGQVEIRDYKTSRVDDPAKANEKAKSSVQLAIYALAWQRMKGDVPAKVVLDFVDTGTMGVSEKSMSDLEKTIGQIEQVAAGIRAGNYQPGKSCFYCSHRRVEVGQALKERV